MKISKEIFYSKNRETTKILTKIHTVFLLIRKRERDRRVPKRPHKNAQKW